MFQSVANDERNLVIRLPAYKLFTVKQQPVFVFLLGLFEVFFLTVFWAAL
jgi:hypothetical protein